jgi:hypothetical protein
MRISPGVAAGLGDGEGWKPVMRAWRFVRRGAEEGDWKLPGLWLFGWWLGLVGWCGVGEGGGGRGGL